VHTCCVLGDGGGGHWLVRMEWRPARWSVCLPLLIFPCTIKTRSSLLAPADPGGPGKTAVKRFWWWWWLSTQKIAISAKLLTVHVHRRYSYHYKKCAKYDLRTNCSVNAWNPLPVIAISDAGVLSPFLNFVLVCMNFQGGGFFSISSNSDNIKVFDELY